MDTFDNIAQYPIYFAPGCQLPAVTAYDGFLMCMIICVVFSATNPSLHPLLRPCDANQHDEEAVFITLCDTCFKIYGSTCANLHMRDFWDVYDEYKSIYPLGEKKS